MRLLHDSASTFLFGVGAERAETSATVLPCSSSVKLPHDGQGKAFLSALSRVAATVPRGSWSS